MMTKQRIPFTPQEQLWAETPDLVYRITWFEYLLEWVRRLSKMITHRS